MARKVTFECRCPQSAGQARIEEADARTVVRTLTFLESGEQATTLEPGKYRVRIRAIGTRKTEFSLRVKKGGVMNPFNDNLPEGETASRRTLTVPASSEGGD